MTFGQRHERRSLKTTAHMAARKKVDLKVDLLTRLAIPFPAMPSAARVPLPASRRALCSSLLLGYVLLGDLYDRIEVGG